MTSSPTAPNPASGFVSRSHRAIAPFDLHRPHRPTDAAVLMSEGALAHAGGIDLVSSLRLGARPSAVVDLGRIDELRRLDVVDGNLIVGAGVSHATLEADERVLSARPDLANAWRTVGNVRVRRTGTVGGNLMAFRPEYDAAPILAAADTTLVFLSPDGTEVTTTVADRRRDLLLLRCEVPLAGGVVFDRSLKPVVSVAIGDNTIAVGCAHSELMVRSRSTSLDLPEPLDDANASARYRKRMITVLVERALRHHEEQFSG